MADVKGYLKDKNNDTIVLNNLLDLFYPVGSYYETSDTDFNPNTTWGGTWIEDSKGRVTVALDNTQTEFNTVDKIGGSKNVQAHNHTLNTAANAGTGSLESGYGLALGNPRYSVPTDNKTTGEFTGWGTAVYGTGDSGNLQPYIVVKRWHRTA